MDPTVSNNNKSRPLLSAQSLSIGYTSGKTENKLFDRLEVGLSAGELVCFMGPNGIGKSSLIRTLSGLQRPLSGQILYYNHETKLEQKLLPQQVSIVLTDHITSTNLTVRELIAYGRYPYLHWNLKFNAKDEALIEQSINQLRIHDIAYKKLFELSDGQLQMAMIARALAQDTPIILLDEPTSHLDLNNRVEIMNLLRKISHEHGKAVLIATHELDLALQTADLIWLADRDKRILTGIPEDLILSGVFDDIFQFKGFDLKTGKIQHEPFRKVSVKLSGEGYHYLWTRNALERNGYSIEHTDYQMEVIVATGGNAWKLIDASGTLEEVYSINSLLQLLQSSPN